MLTQRHTFRLGRCLVFIPSIALVALMGGCGSMELASLASASIRRSVASASVSKSPAPLPSNTSANNTNDLAHRLKRYENQSWTSWYQPPSLWPRPYSGWGRSGY
jgi:hypothetical protein